MDALPGGLHELALYGLVVLTAGQFEREGGDRPPHVGSLCHIPGGDADRQ